MAEILQENSRMVPKLSNWWQIVSWTWKHAYGGNACAVTRVTHATCCNMCHMQRALCVVLRFLNGCILTVHAGQLRRSGEFRWSRIHRGHRHTRIDERCSGNIRLYLLYMADNYSPIWDSLLPYLIIYIGWTEWNAILGENWKWLNASVHEY